jgi:hypothetical protein
MSAPPTRFPLPQWTNTVRSPASRSTVRIRSMVECVDTEEKIQAILPELDQMIGGGLITLERAHVIIYRGEQTESRAKP